MCTKYCSYRLFCDKIVTKRISPRFNKLFQNNTIILGIQNSKNDINSNTLRKKIIEKTFIFFENKAPTIAFYTKKENPFYLAQQNQSNKEKRGGNGSLISWKTQLYITSGTKRERVSLTRPIC